jgi:ribose transport system substrate-binding protein
MPDRSDAGREDELKGGGMDGGVSRRQFLKMAGVAGATIGVGAGLGGLLGACGTGTTTTTAVSAGGTGTTAATAATTATTGGTAATGVSGLIVKKGDPCVAMYTTMDNDYYKTWQLGAKAAADALELSYEAALNQGKPETQISQFETATQKGVKLIYITAPDAANIPRIAQIANAAKAYFTNTWESPAWYSPFDTGDYYVTYFTSNSIQDGYIMAKTLFDAMGKKGNFVHLSGWPGSTPDWQRTVGVDMALKEYPDIKMLDRKPGKWNRIDSRTIMEDMITRFGNQIQGVYGQNDDTGIGAMNALEAANMKGIPITGIDGNAETMDLIKAGRYFAARTTFPFWCAGHSLVRCYDAANGWKPSAFERQMWTDGLVVTKDNVDAYKSRFLAGGDLPLDWKLMSHVLHPDDWDPGNMMWPLDMDVMWQGQDKPANFTMPKAYTDAKAAGEFDKVTQMYKDHYKKMIMG